MNTMRNPTLQPVVSKVDAILKLCGTDVQRDDGQAKGLMYKLGKARLCGLRVRSNHVSLLLFGLAANEPVPSGVTYALTLPPGLTGVSFAGLPPGAIATYDPAAGIVTGRLLASEPGSAGLVAPKGRHL